MCRLPEWKKKTGSCPYDKSIHSSIKTISKKEKLNQKEIGEY